MAVGAPMYAPERQQHIITLARSRGRVEVAALADDLGVTSETVRRDLTALERRGLLRRVHGGALPVERLQQEASLAERREQSGGQKRRIAARAIEEIPEEGVILLDAGSTTQSIAEQFPRDRELGRVASGRAHARGGPRMGVRFARKCTAASDETSEVVRLRRTSPREVHSRIRPSPRTP